MLMLQRCREVKENEEREKGIGFNKLKANQETKERIKSPRGSGEEMEAVSEKRDERCGRFDPGSFVLSFTE